MNRHTYIFNFNFMNICNSCVCIYIYMRGDTGGSKKRFLLYFFYISFLFLFFYMQGDTRGSRSDFAHISFIYIYFFLCDRIQEVQEAISRALGREKEDVEVLIRPEKAGQRRPSPQSSGEIGTKGAEGASNTHTAAAVSSHTGMYACIYI